MRDTSAWIYGGVSINTMAMPARVRESLHLQAVYDHHPMFAGADFEVWSDGAGPMFLEGGDALVIGNGAVLIGMGERTHPAAVELLAQRLFQAEAATQVIAVEIPSQRSSMHLDTVLTMLDVDAFTVFPDARDAMTTYVVTAGRTGLSVEESDDLFDAIARALDVPRIRQFETGATGSRPSASNGTTATTCSRSRRASSWHTNATSTRTTACATGASR